MSQHFCQHTKDLSYTRLTNDPLASLWLTHFINGPLASLMVCSPRQWPTRPTNGPLASLRSSVLSSPMAILLDNGPITIHWHTIKMLSN